MKGRPTRSNERDLSRSLLEAAAKGLREKSHLDLTSREIAEKAGTHAGMVNYYFEGKDGLLSELLNAISNDAHNRMREIRRTLIPGEDPTERIVRGLVAAYHPHADILSVILIEMYRPGSAIRDRYRDHVSERGWHIFPLLEDIVRATIAGGAYRAELDPSLTVWSILSLVHGPLVLEPVSRANGGPRTAPDTEAWIRNAVEMIRAGSLTRADRSG